MGKVLTGLEEVACNEVESLIDSKCETDYGKIIFEAKPEEIYELNLSSRSLLKLLILLCQEKAHDLDDVYRVAKNIDYTEFIPQGKSFGVNSSRYGDQDFTSVDVASKVGQAIIDSVKEKRNERLEVDLDDPDIEIYSLLRDDELFLGINTTGESLHMRSYRDNVHPAPINPTAAYGLLEFSGWAGEILWDPMCGSGTIPIEAALKHKNAAPSINRSYFRFEELNFFDPEVFNEVKSEIIYRSVSGDSSFVGSDKYSKHVELAQANAKEAGVIDLVRFIEGDLAEINIEKDFDYVISNPPFGLRVGDPSIAREVYEKFWDRMTEFDGINITLVTGNDDLQMKAPIKPTDIMEIQLGGLECKFLKYHIG